MGSSPFPGENVAIYLRPRAALEVVDSIQTGVDAFHEPGKGVTCCRSVALRVAGCAAVTRSPCLAQSPSVNVNVTGVFRVCCGKC